MNSKRRNIVICAEDTPAAGYCCQWAVENLFRGEEKDVFHLIYVIKSLKPPMEVFHSLPSTSFSFEQPGKHRESETIIAAKAAIEARFIPILKTKMVPYHFHLYAERTDAPPKKIGDLILKCVEEIDATLVVLSAHNRKPTDTSSTDRWEGEVGSVASYIMKHCKHPMAIVQPQFTA